MHNLHAIYSVPYSAFVTNNQWKTRGKDGTLDTKKKKCYTIRLYKKGV